MSVEMPSMLPAITLWPEWAWAIAWLDKRIENRDWAAGEYYRGRLIAIHAGANIGGRPAKIAVREGLDALMSTAYECGWYVSEDREKTLRSADGSVALQATRYDMTDDLVVIAPIVRKAIVAVAELVDCVWDAPDAGWGVGPCQWRLANVRRLADPIGGVPGAQGIWRVSTLVRDQIARQLEETAA